MVGPNRHRVALAVIAALTVLATTTHAREGLYIGFGLAQQSVKGDFDGTHSLQSESGTTVFFDGKVEVEDPGMAFQIGYGLNRYLGLEFMYVNTRHTARSQPLDRSTDASFTTQVYGGRLTLPFGESVEAFLRLGYGLYDIALNNFSRSGVPLTKTGNVTFLGSGTSAGTGLEIYTGNWRWGLGLTQHNYTFNRAKPEHGSSQGLPKDLTGTATTTDLTLAYHFGT